MNRESIKRSIDNTLYRLHNLVFGALLFFRSDVKKEIKQNFTLKNIHAGESCIILGNGPSLNSFKKERIGSKRTFAVNYFYKNETFRDVEPDFYILIDELFYDVKANDMFQALKRYPNSRFFFKSKIVGKDCFKKVKAIGCKYSVTHNQNVLVGDNVAYDLTENLTASINVVNHCIQVAMYMGFSKIYLVGCDFNAFTSAKPIYSYSATNEGKDYTLGAELGFYSAVCYHHYALAIQAKKMNIQIINATPNSLLDAYPIGELP